jgi:hypothetical protein
VFEQLERLLKAITPPVVVAAVTEKLDGPIDPTELGAEAGTNGASQIFIADDRAVSLCGSC